VQVSINPISYITKVPATIRKLTGIGAHNARERCGTVEQGVHEWMRPNSISSQGAMCLPRFCVSALWTRVALGVRAGPSGWLFAFDCEGTARIVCFYDHLPPFRQIRCAKGSSNYRALTTSRNYIMLRDRSAQLPCPFGRSNKHLKRLVYQYRSCMQVRQHWRERDEYRNFMVYAI